MGRGSSFKPKELFKLHSRHFVPDYYQPVPDKSPSPSEAAHHYLNAYWEFLFEYYSSFETSEVLAQ
jgi:hypothetical protein